MNVSLKPDAQRFVEQQLREGRFTSADDLLDEAIHRMMLDANTELDDDTIAAINRAEAQIDRGEGIAFDQFAVEMRQRIARS